MFFLHSELCCDVSPGGYNPSLCPLCLYLSFASWRFYPRLCPFLLSVALEVVASRNTALRRRCCQLRYWLPFPLPPRLLRQPGLSLKDTLDRAEATAACPARMPNLLALAEAIRPLNGNVFAGAAAAAGLPSSGGSNNHSKKRKGGAGILPGASGFASRFPPLDTTLLAADTQASATEAPTVPPWKTATATADGQATVPKKMRVDVSAILCPFELNGVCNDDDCR